MKHFMMALIALSLFLVTPFDQSLNATLANQQSPSQTDKFAVVYELSALFKDQVKDLSDEEMNQLLQREYIKLHFLDRNGEWKSDELADLSDQLFPHDLSAQDAIDLIDQVAVHVTENPYLVRFLNSTKKYSFPKIRQKFVEEGKQTIPQVIAWAIALENLTQAQLNDPQVLETVYSFWKEERVRAKLNIKNMGLFGAIKLKSVEEPIRKMVAFHNGKKLDPRFLRGFLSLNILEAVVADSIMGYFANARAGWPLIANKAGDRANPRLGTGPATFSPDGNKLEIRMAMPKAWADLYQVWNMAFVSQIENYPFWMVKLLIPQVSNYKDHPEEYIYRRALALYSSLHYIFFGYVEDTNDGIATINWQDKKLTKQFGHINAKSAKRYKKLVKKNR